MDVVVESDRVECQESMETQVLVNILQYRYWKVILRFAP